MKTIFILWLFFLGAVVSVNGQVCNNPLDTVCQCKDSLPPAIYLRNGSFESIQPDSCPVYPYGIINNSQGLLYWTCGNTMGSAMLCKLGCSDSAYWDGSNYFSPPLPIPDGRAFINVIDVGDGLYGQKGYIATCLSKPLISGNKYTFEFYVGFSPADTNNRIFRSPYEFTIYGHPDCGYDAIPFADKFSIGCPTNAGAYGGGYIKPGWVKLGSAIVSGKAQWVKARIDFAPPENISGFIFGPNCSNVGQNNSFAYYADDFSLTETSLLKFRTITADSGGCTNGIVLQAPPNTGARAYQWYRDNAAISGATDPVYTVSSSSDASGSYSVRMVFSSNCILSDPFYVDLSTLRNFSLGKDTLLCYGDTLVLKPGISNVHYLWQDGSAGDSFSVARPGTYSLQLTDQFGCSTAKSISVGFENCTACDIYVPTAFTPNGDGVNDVLRAKSLCAHVDGFHLVIYNRWGQAIFEAKNTSEGWDGSFKGRPQETGTYIYFLSYKRHGAKKPLQKKGVITLVR
ncbi:MAG: gliding motility-associated C-terminal domain-containing protein [Bacteroidetes bacterium]|nr:gliding motility-associated C-terminal domain-containing protein [Bacteroidota bacterium]MBS1975183.1 gliding motility-associated C-terminal domain-containing protein [Bacteroidota bacterium]